MSGTYGADQTPLKSGLPLDWRGAGPAAGLPPGAGACATRCNETARTIAVPQHTLFIGTMIPASGAGSCFGPIHPELRIRWPQLEPADRRSVADDRSADDLEEAVGEQWNGRIVDGR